MRLALQEAQKAYAAEEVPTGCVIMRLIDATAGLPGAESPLIARAHNQTETLKDPTAHAEILAITQAAAALGDWRLENTILFVTKEPCPMCAGAIVLARIPVVVYGLPDPKRGGISVFNILRHDNLNHKAEIIPGILKDECRAQFQAFFRERREK